MKLLSAALASAALLLLLAPGARCAEKASGKPRLNGWRALYDFARRKGIQYTRRGGTPINSPAFLLDVEGGEIWVPAASTLEPMAGDECALLIEMRTNSECPECENIPGFDRNKYRLFYLDKGCKGEFAALHPFPPRDTDDLGKQIGTARRNRAYMKAWLTPPIFDYLGLLLLQRTRELYRSE